MKGDNLVPNAIKSSLGSEVRDLVSPVSARSKPVVRRS